MSIKAYFIDQR